MRPPVSVPLLVAALEQGALGTWEDTAQWIMVFRDNKDYKVMRLICKCGCVVCEKQHPYFIIRSPICNTFHVHIFINLHDLFNL